MQPADVDAYIAKKRAREDALARRNVVKSFEVIDFHIRTLRRTNRKLLEEQYALGKVGLFLCSSAAFLPCTLDLYRAL